MDLPTALRVMREEQGAAELERQQAKSRVNASTPPWGNEGAIPRDICVVTLDGERFGVMGTVGYFESESTRVLWDEDGLPQSLSDALEVSA